MIVGSFCDNVGVIFGINFRSFWTHFGIILGSVWDHSVIKFGAIRPDLGGRRGGQEGSDQDQASSHKKNKLFLKFPATKPTIEKDPRLVAVWGLCWSNRVKSIR